MFKGCILMLNQSLSWWCMSLISCLPIEIVYGLIKGFSFSVLSLFIKLLHEQLKLLLHLVGLALQIFIQKLRITWCNAHIFCLLVCFNLLDIHLSKILSSFRVIRILTKWFRREHFLLFLLYNWLWSRVGFYLFFDFFSSFRSWSLCLSFDLNFLHLNLFNFLGRRCLLHWRWNSLGSYLDLRFLFFDNLFRNSLLFSWFRLSYWFLFNYYGFIFLLLLNNYSFDIDIFSQF